MVPFTIVILVLAIWEMRKFWKQKHYKDLVLYALVSVVTLAFGYWYISNPYRSSFSYIALKLLGLKV